MRRIGGEKTEGISNIKPDIRIFEDRIKYFVFIGEREAKYRDIDNVDIVTQKDALMNAKRSGFGLRLNIFVNNAILCMRDGRKIMLNMHWKSNLIEILRFFESKKIKLSDKAVEFLKENN
jgi:hypothetical protein